MKQNLELLNAGRIIHEALALETNCYTIDHQIEQGFFKDICYLIHNDNDFLSVRISREFTEKISFYDNIIFPWADLMKKDPSEAEINIIYEKLKTLPSYDMKFGLIICSRNIYIGLLKLMMNEKEYNLKEPFRLGYISPEEWDVDYIKNLISSVDLCPSDIVLRNISESNYTGNKRVFGNRHVKKTQNLVAYIDDLPSAVYLCYFYHEIHRLYGFYPNILLLDRQEELTCSWDFKKICSALGLPKEKLLIRYNNLLNFQEYLSGNDNLFILPQRRSAQMRSKIHVAHKFMAFDHCRYVIKENYDELINDNLLVNPYLFSKDISQLVHNDWVVNKFCANNQEFEDARAIWRGTPKQTISYDYGIFASIKSYFYRRKVEARINNLIKEHRPKIELCYGIKL